MTHSWCESQVSWRSINNESRSNTSGQDTEILSRRERGTMIRWLWVPTFVALLNNNNVQQGALAWSLDVNIFDQERFMSRLSIISKWKWHAHASFFLCLQLLFILEWCLVLTTGHSFLLLFPYGMFMVEGWTRHPCSLRSFESKQAPRDWCIDPNNKHQVLLLRSAAVLVQDCLDVYLK